MTDCIDCGTGKDRAGYGRSLVGGRGGVWRLKHRMAWEAVYGAIPEGLFVCHKCDNPSCVNPNHLFLGTPRENCADCISKGRGIGKRGPDKKPRKRKD
jgi:hypothetical protein